MVLVASTDEQQQKVLMCGGREFQRVGAVVAKPRSLKVQHFVLGGRGVAVEKVSHIVSLYEEGEVLGREWERF